MGILQTLAVLAVVLPLIIILVAFLKAFTVRQITGKWPHQSEEAQELYNWLMKNG